MAINLTTNLKCEKSWKCNILKLTKAEKILNSPTSTKYVYIFLQQFKKFLSQHRQTNKPLDLDEFTGKFYKILKKKT